MFGRTCRAHSLQPPALTCNERAVVVAILTVAGCIPLQETGTVERAGHRIAGRVWVGPQRRQDVGMRQVHPGVYDADLHIPVAKHTLLPQRHGVGGVEVRLARQQGVVGVRRGLVNGGCAVWLAGLDVVTGHDCLAQVVCILCGVGGSIYGFAQVPEVGYELDTWNIIRHNRCSRRTGIGPITDTDGEVVRECDDDSHEGITRGQSQGQTRHC